MYLSFPIKKTQALLNSDANTILGSLSTAIVFCFWLAELTFTTKTPVIGTLSHPPEEKEGILLDSSWKQEGDSTDVLLHVGE